MMAQYPSGHGCDRWPELVQIESSLCLGALTRTRPCTQPMKSTPLHPTFTPMLKTLLSLSLTLPLGLTSVLAQDLKSATTDSAPLVQSAKATTITFQEFFLSPIGPKGMQFSPTALALAGQAVASRGVMVKTDRLQKGRFLLAPQALEVNEDDDGPANDLPVSTVLVKLAPAQTNLLIAHQEGPLRLEGTLDIGRQENNRGEVSWIRLLASPVSVNVLSSDTKIKTEGKDG